MALIARMTRASVLEVLEADHVRMGRANGLPAVVVLNPESEFDLRVVSERHRPAGGRGEKAFAVVVPWEPWPPTRS